MIHMYNVCDNNYDDESLFVFRLRQQADDKCYTCALNYA